MGWQANSRHEPEGTYVFVGDRTVVPSKVRWLLEGVKGAPDAVVTFEVRDGAPMCTEVVVRASDSGRGLRSSDLQALNLERTAEIAFLWGSRVMEVPEDDPSGAVSWRPPRDERELWAALGEVTTAAARPRGKPTVAELSQVAEVYRKHVDGRPVQAVATLLHYSTRTAHRRVQQAREAGLLPKTTPGKARA